MKNKGKLYPIALALAALIFSLILVSSTVSADTAQSTSPTITETRITTSGLAGISAIYGDRIVWDDWRNKELSSRYNANIDIYMYNFSTKKESKITSSKSAIFPDIYNNRIVWSDNRSGNMNIFMYDLSTSKETQISSTGINKIWPHIYDNNIVWQGNQNGGSDIYMFNLSTQKETRITSSRSAVFPAIYGDRVVWSDNRNGKWDIYMYNISSLKEVKVSSSGSAVFSAIYGDRIVWSDSRNGNRDLYMYNLSTSRETQITKSESVNNPAIFGDLIVWANNLDGKSNIYMYNLTTRQESHISSSSYQYYPAVYGNRIVWTDGRDGNLDIYMATLSYLPVAAFSVSPVSGTVPLKVTFKDSSSGSPISWKWNFGDGNTSTEQNPTHTYSAAGNFTAALTVTNAAGSNTISKPNYVVVTRSQLLPLANFTSDLAYGYTPLTVTFTDKSTEAPTSWIWSFGDNTSSTVKNPVHVYNKAGKYTVTLVAGNKVGSSTAKKTDYINVINKVGSPVAAFTALPVSGKAPLTVAFTDKSTNNPTSWFWDLGDKTTLNTRNPVHTYSKVGKYTVSLTVTNAAGSNTTKKTSYVTVESLPTAAFSASPTSVEAPLKVQFTEYRFANLMEVEFWR
jgi:beta propeller repeat protein